jgi:BirA family biotin operon repressor/biotin-[acetyl-CoA-carboxylase] ligase
MRKGLPAGLQAALDALTTRRPDLPLDVRWFDAVPSTMDIVAQAAASGAMAGRVAVADQQTAGRGRRGRTWWSPPAAGLYFSYLARPMRHVELLTLAAGVGVLEGVAAATGLRAHLKWPNDLLVGPRKLAGLLAEGMQLGTADAAVTIGVGLNLEPSAYPPDVAARATSLRLELGHGVSRFEVFTAILEHLADILQTLEAGDADGILQAWRAASPTAVGTRVSWADGGVERHGVTSGVDDAGALLVRTPAGLQRVVAGELAWHLA